MVKVVGQPHTSLSFREIPTHLTTIRGKLGAGCKYSIFSCANQIEDDQKFRLLFYKYLSLQYRKLNYRSYLLILLIGSTMQSMTYIDPLTFRLHVDLDLLAPQSILNGPLISD